MLRNAGQQAIKRARVASPTPRPSSYLRPISFFSSPPPPSSSNSSSAPLTEKQDHPDTVPRSRAGTNTISQAEIAHFSALAAHWWDPTGEFALLHRMNPSRIEFTRDSIMRHEELTDEGRNARWLQGKDVLDVGCGGGIFAEVSSRVSRRLEFCMRCS